MAYMSQQKKKELVPAIKAVLAKYGVKATIGVRNYSTLVVTLRSGKIDFGDAKTINVYWVDSHWDGVAKDFLKELVAAMNVGNWDKSDIMTDYFNCGHYIDINIGEWNKPYICVP